jgi:uncharacterized damage-inducible protein DinB
MRKGESNLSVLNQFILFAEYNRLMNQRLFAATARLSDEDINKDNKAFFKSVLGTLNHVMVGDIIWLKRFAEHPSSHVPLSYISELEKPRSLNAILFNDFSSLRNEREKIDAIIIQWVNCLSESAINECITYRDMAGDNYNKPYLNLISHLFLHQVHHRGQATTLLSQYGEDFGDTDLIEIINECSASRTFALAHLDN